MTSSRKPEAIRNAARGGTSHGRRQDAHKLVNYVAVWFSSYASGETNKQANMYILITISRTPPGGEIMLYYTLRAGRFYGEGEGAGRAMPPPPVRGLAQGRSQEFHLWWGINFNSSFQFQN